MKNQALQNALDELRDDADDAMGEIAEPDLESISGGQQTFEPPQCTDYTHCGSYNTSGSTAKA